jgi:hypothetical protein
MDSQNYFLKKKIKNMKIGKTYLINNKYILEFRGIGYYPDLQFEMITTTGMVVNIITEIISICDEPLSRFGVICVKDIFQIKELKELNPNFYLNELSFEVDYDNIS